MLFFTSTNRIDVDCKSFWFFLFFLLPVRNILKRFRITTQSFGFGGPIKSTAKMASLF